MKLLYIGSHSILEYDEVRLFADLGYDVFSIGSYTDPANPSDDKRPPILNLPYHADLDFLCRLQREKHAGEDMRFYIDPAKSDLHPDLIDWADTIIFAAFPEAWIVPQWARLRHKRIIWRTIGQSDPTIERYLAPLFREGLEIIRYSPAEQRAFAPYGFAGETAVIRFAKYPEDWGDWNGEDIAVGNITQDMYGRGEACGYSFWLAATQDLPTRPAGPNSQALPGGIGQLAYEDMRTYLRNIRAYLYTGTQPASYTLGLIEAMLTGVPIVSIGAARMGLPSLFEAAEFLPWVTDSPEQARINLERLLNDEEDAWQLSQVIRKRALDLFCNRDIGLQWQALFAGVAVAA